MAQQKKTAKPSYYTQTIIVLILILLSVSIYTVARYVIRKPSAFEEVMMCREKDCGYIFVVKHSADEKPPFVCEKCRKNTAYKAFHCKDCDYYFPSELAASGLLIECTRCLSKNVEDVHAIP